MSSHAGRGPCRAKSRRKHPCFLSLVALCLAACASPPEIYEPLEPVFVERQRVIVDDRPQIEVGRPNVVLDGLNHYVLSAPTKLILFNAHMLDHRLPEENRRVLERYLALNGMRGVKVRHNQYAPAGELFRLWNNTEVGFFYRMTFGLLTWAQYTAFPDRLLAGFPGIGGGDHFNPYTNTINVYSSDLAVLLHEAGHAKDYARQSSKGTWTLLRILPGIDLMEEGYASFDAVSFLNCIEDERAELRAYRALVPAYSTYVSGYAPGGLEVTLPIVLIGHVVGWLRSAGRGRALDRAAEGAAPWLVQRRAFQPAACRQVSEDEAADESPHGEATEIEER